LLQLPREIMMVGQWPVLNLSAMIWARPMSQTLCYSPILSSPPQYRDEPPPPLLLELLHVFWATTTQDDQVQSLPPQLVLKEKNYLHLLPKTILQEFRVRQSGVFHNPCYLGGRSRRIIVWSQPSKVSKRCYLKNKLKTWLKW
jgi:hypothetical protein